MAVIERGRQSALETPYADQVVCLVIMDARRVRRQRKHPVWTWFAVLWPEISAAALASARDIPIRMVPKSDGPVIDQLPLDGQVEDLGTVTAPAGDLVLIDFGLLHLWSGESAPTLDPDHVGEEIAATANSAVDFQIVGDNPVAAGQALSLAAVAGRYAFDIPAARADDMRDLVVSSARRNGFTVDLQPVARLPHRVRVARLLDDCPNGVEIPFGGPWAVAVRGLPRDHPMPVRGVRMSGDGPDPGRWHSVWVEVDQRTPVRTQEIGHVGVDEARLAFAGPEALTSWTTDETTDGLADIVFWGRDAHLLVERTGAGSFDDDTHGWTDLLVQDATDRACDLHRIKDTEGLLFAFDLRLHNDHHRLLAVARTSPTESGSIEIAGETVCGFFTSWGDGAFPVHRDLADDGTLCRIRVELGAPEIVERQRRLDDLWFGDMSQLAIVNMRISRDAEPAGWLYREEPNTPEDSGWRVLLGDETDEELDDPQTLTFLPLRDLIASEAGLEPLLRTPGPVEFHRDSSGEFVLGEPRKD